MTPNVGFFADFPVCLKDAIAIGIQMLRVICLDATAEGYASHCQREKTSTYWRTMTADTASKIVQLWRTFSYLVHGSAAPGT